MVYSIMPMRGWALAMGQICCRYATSCAHIGRLISLKFYSGLAPSRPKSSSPKTSLLLALLSISGGNAFASVASLSANPTLMALKLPAKGSQSVMGQLDSHPEWWDTLCAVEHKAPPPFTRAKSMFIPKRETRETMERLGCTRYYVAKLLNNFSRNRSDIVVSFRYEFQELFRESRQDPAPVSLPLNFVRNLTRVGVSKSVSWNPISALGFTVDQ